MLPKDGYIFYLEYFEVQRQDRIHYKKNAMIARGDNA
jgi:hypothetical protein